MTGNTTIVYEDELVSANDAINIGDTLFGMVYMPCTITWRGNPAIESGDIILAVDKNSNSHNILIMEQNMSFRGGMDSTITCAGVPDEDISFYK